MVDVIYESRVSTQQLIAVDENALGAVGSLFPVYHGSILRDFKHNQTFIGLLERRPDGIYFVPDSGVVGRIEVISSLAKNLRKADSGLGIRKINPNTEVIEVFDREGNHLSTIRLRGS